MLDTHDNAPINPSPREARIALRALRARDDAATARAFGAGTAERAHEIAHRVRARPTPQAPGQATLREPAQPPERGICVSLLERDSELAQAVDSADGHRGRPALPARAYRLAPGPVALTSLTFPPTTFAALVLRGSLIHQTQVAQGAMIEFISSGDVMMPFSPDPDGVRGRVTMTATEDALVAALDHQFVRAAAIWPQLMVVVGRRLCEQQHRLALHGAICQLPRIEQRVMALMWHLADRLGKVTPDGILLTRPLNHQALADLVSARRPTVSVAIKALREQGHLRRRVDGRWLLPHRDQARAASFEELIAELNGGTVLLRSATAPSDTAVGGSGGTR